MTSQYQGPYNGPEGPVSLSDRQGLAQQVVGVVEWSEDGFWGYCACPGAALHNGKTARRDCRVFTGLRGDRQESPNVYCLHTSCLAPVEAATLRLRQLVGKAKAAAGRSLPRPPSGNPKGVRTVSNTARTFNFSVREGGDTAVSPENGQKPTARTEENRPLTRFTRARTPAHDPAKPAKETSEPYQPVAATPKPTPAKVAPKAVKQAEEEPGIGVLWIKGEPLVRVKTIGGTIEPIEILNKGDIPNE